MRRRGRSDLSRSHDGRRPRYFMHDRQTGFFQSPVSLDLRQSSARAETLSFSRYPEIWHTASEHCKRRGLLSVDRLWNWHAEPDAISVFKHPNQSHVALADDGHAPNEARNLRPADVGSGFQR